MKKQIISELAPDAVGPYSQGIKSGDFYFLSGQLGVDKATGKMPESAVDQARQSLNNVGHVLAAEGLKMNDIIKTTVFLDNIDDFAAVNEVYATFFEQPFPARSAFEVGALPLGAKVEIEVIARKA